MQQFEPVEVDTLMTHEATIYFDKNSSKLSEQALITIGEISYLPNRVGQIRIVANADSSGILQHNINLTNERADNVKAHLVEFGLDPDHVATIGLGSLHPADEQNDANNRTAIIKFQVKEKVMRAPNLTIWDYFKNKFSR